MATVLADHSWPLHDLWRMTSVAGLNHRQVVSLRNIPVHDRCCIGRCDVGSDQHGCAHHRGERGNRETRALSRSSHCINNQRNQFFVNSVEGLGELSSPGINSGGMDARLPEPERECERGRERLARGIFYAVLSCALCLLKSNFHCNRSESPADRILTLRAHWFSQCWYLLDRDIDPSQ